MAQKTNSPPNLGVAPSHLLSLPVCFWADLSIPKRIITGLLKKIHHPTEKKTALEFPGEEPSTMHRQLSPKQTLFLGQNKIWSTLHRYMFHQFQLNSWTFFFCHDPEPKPNVFAEQKNTSSRSTPLIPPSPTKIFPTKIRYTPWSLTARPWKNGGWKTIPFLLGFGNSSGANC